jgi:hypothetical protein
MRTANIWHSRNDTKPIFITRHIRHIPRKKVMVRIKCVVCIRISFYLLYSKKTLVRKQKLTSIPVQSRLSHMNYGF